MKSTISQFSNEDTYMITNLATGEIESDNFKFPKPHTIKDKQKKIEFIEKDRLSYQFKSMQRDVCGNFVFFMFKHIDILKDILTDSELVKFIYIGTYTKKDGVLKLDNNHTYINKELLKKLLKISDRTFNTFFNKLINNNLLKECNGSLYINLNIFYRGSEKDYKKLANQEFQDFSRIYIETTRNLYSNTTSQNHPRIAIAYKLLPFVNWKYNILCHNISEENKDLLNPLTISEIMDILGYNKSQIARFKKSFYNINCKKYKMFITVQSDAEYTNSITLVNPLIFYRGNDIKSLEYLCTLFKINISKNN